MKRLAIIIYLVLPMMLYAGVIVKKSGDRLEDISIKSSEGEEFVYVDENGVEGRVPRAEVSAVLYDDGRYEEINTQPAPIVTNNEARANIASDVTTVPQGSYTPVAMDENSKQYNVYAYGVYAGMGYFSKGDNEGFVVEYRVIYKNQDEEPQFEYLGTTPFAYVTDKMAENSFVGRGNPYLMNIMEPKALVIPNDKDVKKIEFRLSKPGYKTTIVKPFKDVLIGCGPLLMISLDKIRPLKDGEVDETPAVVTTVASAKAVQSATSIPNEESYSPTSEETYVPQDPTYETKDVSSQVANVEETSTSTEDVVAAPIVATPVLAVASQETDTSKKSAKKKEPKEKEPKAKKEPATPDYSEYQDGQIHKLSSNQFYFEDRTYTKKEINSIVVGNCPDAEQYYKNAKKWVVGGWSGVAASTALIVVGSVLLPIGMDNENRGYSSSHWVDTYSYYDEYGYEVTVYGHYESDYGYGNNDGTGMAIAGACLLGVGCAGFVTSLAIACVGHHRMNNAFKVYNSSCANKKEPALSLNFGPTRNGIGLTLNF